MAGERGPLNPPLHLAGLAGHFVASVSLTMKTLGAPDVHANTPCLIAFVRATPGFSRRRCLDNGRAPGWQLCSLSRSVTNIDAAGRRAAVRWQRLNSFTATS